MDVEQLSRVELLKDVEEEEEEEKEEEEEEVVEDADLEEILLRSHDKGKRSGWGTRLSWFNYSFSGELDEEDMDNALQRLEMR